MFAIERSRPKILGGVVRGAVEPERDAGVVGDAVGRAGWGRRDPCGSARRTAARGSWRNVATYGMYPNVAMPAAMLTMFCSAMPTLKNRSGWRRSKSTVRLEYLRSAVSTTILESVSASSASTSPATKERFSFSDVARSQLAGSDGVGARYGSVNSAPALLSVRLRVGRPPGSRDARCARAPCS